MHVLLCHVVYFEIPMRKTLIDSNKISVGQCYGYIFFSMCPGNNRAIAGIHRVESLTAGNVRDIPDDLAALEERNMIAESSEVRLTAHDCIAGVNLRPALPRPVLPCPAPSCPALPCPALPCPALPCPVLSCPALPCPFSLLAVVQGWPNSKAALLFCFIGKFGRG